MQEPLLGVRERAIRGMLGSRKDSLRPIAGRTNEPRTEAGTARAVKPARGVASAESAVRIRPPEAGAEWPWLPHRLASGSQIAGPMTGCRSLAPRCLKRANPSPAQPAGMANQVRFQR